LRSFDHESCSELLDSWHSPSNAHAYRLYVVKELALTFVLARRLAQTEILTRF
jgi:hypothetical protein